MNPVSDSSYAVRVTAQNKVGGTRFHQGNKVENLRVMYPRNLALQIVCVFCFLAAELQLISSFEQVRM
jgi:hypothetical protein